MSSFVEMCHDELQVGCATRQDRGLVSVVSFQRIVRTWFESRTIARRGSGCVDFVRSSTAKRLVRTVLVVPDDVANELVVEVGQTYWHDDLSDQFILECSIESFDDGNGAVLSERTKARLDALRVAPELVTFTELRTLVADDVLGRSATKRDCQIESVRNRLGAGTLTERFGEDALSREVVDDREDACSLARARTCAICTLPMFGHEAFMALASSETKTGNRLTGLGSARSALGPCSSTRCSQFAMVASVT